MAEPASQQRIKVLYRLPGEVGLHRGQESVEHLRSRRVPGHRRNVPCDTSPMTGPTTATDTSAGATAAARRLAERVEAAAARVGVTMAVDGPAELAGRADGPAAVGGRTSVGGATHLLACADGWIAVSLARPADVELVPAWLALAGAPPGWELAEAVAACSGAALAEAAATVGLPVGTLGETEAAADGGIAIEDHGPGSERTDGVGGLRVVDLSALWAGPLAAHLLGRAGAQVTKVESVRRPDASRTGRPELFHRLNGGKDHRAVDLDRPGGIEDLRTLIRGADVVVESSRPRALEQLGIVAADELARPGGPTVWVSITGHGRRSPRVAFGDDAAVAGGLVGWGDDGPAFVGDAVADPLAGLSAAAGALDLLAGGRRALVDVALASVAASAAALAR